MSNFQQPYNILLFGDSITELGDDIENLGFAALLRDYYRTKAQVTNFGINTANTKQILDMVQHSQFSDMLPKTIDQIFINLGANDAAGSLDDTIVPPPLKKWKYRDPAQTEQYAEACREVSSLNSIKYIDIRSKMKTGKQKIWVDGIHLNKLGNQQLFQLMVDQIGDLPQWRNEIRSWKFCPDGNEINHLGECSAKNESDNYNDQQIIKNEQIEQNSLNIQIIIAILLISLITFTALYVRQKVKYNRLKKRYNIVSEAEK